MRALINAGAIRKMSETPVTPQARNALASAQAKVAAYCREQLNCFREHIGDYIDQHLEASTLQKRADLKITRQTAIEKFSTLEALYQNTLNTASINNQTNVPNLSFSETALSPSEIKLESKETTEINALFSSLIGKQDRIHQGPLFALRLRKQSAIGETNNRSNLLPQASDDGASPRFSPEELTKPFRSWVGDISLPHSGVVILIELFKQSFFLHLDRLYDDLNQVFIDAGVLPNFKPRSHVEHEHQSNAPHSVETNAEQNHKTARLDLVDSYARQTNLHAMYAPALSERTQIIDKTRPALSKEQLLDFINNQEQAHENYHKLSQSLAGLYSNVRETQYALDCVGYLLDSLEHDTSLAPQFREEIQSIHAPLMRLALIDESFLSNPRHVARELIETIVDYCEFWDEQQPISSHNSNIREDVQRLLKHMRQTTPIDDTENHLFYQQELHTLANRLQTLEKRASLSIQRHRERFIGQQKYAEKEFIANEFVRNRLIKQKAPRPIADFLAQEWAQVLTNALLQTSNQRQKAPNSDWQRYSSLVDDILALIKPDRKRQLSELQSPRVDAIYSTLEQGLKTINIESQAIDRHREQLNTCAELAIKNAEMLLAASTNHSTENAPYQNITRPVPAREKHASGKREAMPEALKQIRRLDAGSHLRMRTSAGTWALVKVIQTHLKTNSLLICSKNGINIGTFSFDELAIKLEYSELHILSDRDLDTPLFEKMFAGFSGHRKAKPKTSKEFTV